MKITPDYKGRDDEWTGGSEDKYTVRYYESIDSEGYFYELYVNVDGIKSAIIITDDGVSIDYRAGSCCGSSVHTNLVPRRLFGEKKELTWPYLKRIIRILESTDGEGRFYTKEEMRAQYQEWLDLGKP